MGIHPTIAAGLVIVLMFAGLTCLVLLYGDGRKSVESEKQEDLPPSDFEGW